MLSHPPDLLPAFVVLIHRRSSNLWPPPRTALSGAPSGQTPPTLSPKSGATEARSGRRRVGEKVRYPWAAGNLKKKKIEGNKVAQQRQRTEAKERSRIETEARRGMENSALGKQGRGEASFWLAAAADSSGPGPGAVAAVPGGTDRAAAGRGGELDQAAGGDGQADARRFAVQPAPGGERD